MNYISFINKGVLLSFAVLAVVTTLNAQRNRGVIY